MAITQNIANPSSLQTPDAKSMAGIIPMALFALAVWAFAIFHVQIEETISAKLFELFAGAGGLVSELGLPTLARIESMWPANTASQVIVFATISVSFALLAEVLINAVPEMPSFVGPVLYAIAWVAAIVSCFQACYYCVFPAAVDACYAGNYAHAILYAFIMVAVVVFAIERMIMRGLDGTFFSVLGLGASAYLTCVVFAATSIVIVSLSIFGILAIQIIVLLLFICFMPTILNVVFGLMRNM